MTDGETTGSRGRGETGPVIRRAVQLLAAFTPERPSLTLTQLARRTGLPLTTTHRLVGDLVECGLLERDAGGAFHVGLRLWEIASLAPRGLGLRELALPFMEDLYAVTQENVQLAVREGLESVWVERIAGRSAVPVFTRVGGRFALHATGVGRVLLAHAPPEVQEAVLAGPLDEYTALTITSPEALRRLLGDVRAHGFAVNDRQVSMETLSVAAPVRGAEGSVVAAVSIVVQAGSALPAALSPAVQATARGISRALRDAAVEGD
ncbi:IclR family transcriptional regulator [Geodermatophilus sabuli]|uniref:Glycerol operon regulatory protein n=1 Tax=Geodermatophilus sabuli TaxID=1564158 RepID=A0A285EA45_9ACTN|nr:IclR family transcriptional regulator [Geodermatophilus sabuli]MBB3085581.1 DNA-binding IclR family transcriptional regulator [Geodermatophilus sabuli]SNX95999.1 transcriptional regulator, IclR family [Geodermatophilus sabuli]